MSSKSETARGSSLCPSHLAGSQIRGSEEAILSVQRGAGHYFQRPEADHVEVDSSATSLAIAVGSFWVGKIAGGKIRGGFGGHLRTPGLELNDLGFLGEADQRQLFASVRHVQNQPQAPVRSWSVNLNPLSMWSTGGERIFTQLGHNVNFQLKSFWGGGWWMGKQLPSTTTMALRGETAPQQRRPPLGVPPRQHPVRGVEPGSHGQRRRRLLRRTGFRAPAGMESGYEVPATNVLLVKLNYWVNL